MSVIGTTTVSTVTNVTVLSLDEASLSPALMYSVLTADVPRRRHNIYMPMLLDDVGVLEQN